MSNLEQEIASALRDDAVTSDMLSGLISEVEAAITQAEVDVANVRREALDPLAMPDASKARTAIEDAEFAHTRLKSLLPKLQQRFGKVSRQEVYDRWVVDYEKVKALRDAAAEELKDLYPQFAARLVDLLQRIEEIDRGVQAVNTAKPFDAEAANGDGRWLRSVELEARGLKNLGMHDLSLMTDLKLPSWTPATVSVWPVYRPLDPAMIAPFVGGDPRLHTDRWWEPWEEEQRRARSAAE